jgi:hypothetical protein
MSVVLAFEGNGKRNWTLADQAAAINKDFDRLDRADNRRQTAEITSNYARQSAGSGLIEAKAMLKKQDPGLSFEAWCEANIKRSMRDIYRCMCIASSDDPERAIWKERAEAAEGMTESRNTQKRSADKQDSPYQQSKSVQTAIGLYRKMTVEDREEVKQAQQEIDNA